MSDQVANQMPDEDQDAQTNIEAQLIFMILWPQATVAQLERVFVLRNQARVVGKILDLHMTIDDNLMTEYQIAEAMGDKAVAKLRLEELHANEENMLKVDQSYGAIMWDLDRLMETIECQ